MGFDDDKAKVFDIAIQTGAILAVILVYWQKIRDTVVALPTQKQAQQFALNVLIAFVPAVLLGLLFGKAIKAHLFTPVVVASTTMPNTMRYQANPLKLWVEMKRSNQRTHNQALMKENSSPTPNIGRSAMDKSPLSLYRL